MSDQPAPSTNNFFQRIRVQNLLSFGPNSGEINLKPLNIIIGQNGVGKSNLLTFFELLSKLPFEALVLNQFISKLGGLEELKWKGEAYNDNLINIQITYNEERIGRPLNYSLSVNPIRGAFSVYDESLEEVEKVDPNKPSPYFYYRNYRGNPVISKYDGSKRRRNLVPEPLKDISNQESILAQRKGSEYFPEITRLTNVLSGVKIYKETDFGINSPIRHSAVPSISDELSNDFSNLVGYIENIFNNVKIQDSFNSYLKKFNSRIHSLQVKGENGFMRKLFLRETGLETLLPSERFSDGTLHFICLLAILLNPKPPKLVCIEEPENGLHPDAIHLVAELLKEASKRMQIIVTTHSADLVNYFTDTPEVIMVAEKGETGTEFKRLSNDDADLYSEHGLGNAWMMGLIGGVKK